MLTESAATIKSVSVLLQLAGLPLRQLAPSTTAVFDAMLPATPVTSASTW